MPNVNESTKLLTKHYLDKADVVTVISFKVKNDLEKFYTNWLSNYINK